MCHLATQLLVCQTGAGFLTVVNNEYIRPGGGVACMRWERITVYGLALAREHSVCIYCKAYIDRPM